jgi:hypothetical protein
MLGTSRHVLAFDPQNSRRGDECMDALSGQIAFGRSSEHAVGTAFVLAWMFTPRANC